MSSAPRTDDASASANSDDDVVVRYAARILALKAERDAAIDGDDLVAIARDLGMSDADLAAVAAAAAAHVVRARGYREHGRLADAVVELEQAAALSPRDVATLFALADVLRARFVADRDSDNGRVDAARARALAKSCLALTPDHRPSFALLNDLDGPRPAARRSARPAVVAFVGTAVVAVALGGSAVVRLIDARTSASTVAIPAQVPATPTMRATVPATVSATVPATVPAPAADVVATAVEPGDTGTFDLPVTLVDGAKSTGLQLDVRKSVLSRYPDSAFFELHAVVNNQRPALIEHIAWKIEVLDTGDFVVATATLDGPASHEAALRPGDAQPLYRLFSTPPSASSVRLTVVRIEEEPMNPRATSPPAPSPAVELHWQIDKPAGVTVVVRERNRSLSAPTFGLGPFFGATWEVENTGSTPVHLLKLDIRAVDAAGNALVMPGPFGSAQYVTAPSQPALRPGDVRLLRTTMTVPAGFARAELWVIELN